MKKLLLFLKFIYSLIKILIALIKLLKDYWPDDQ